MAFHVEIAAAAQIEADEISTVGMPAKLACARLGRFQFPGEMRHLPYGRKPHVYRILFTIDGDSVLILHSRRPRQRAIEEMNPWRQ